MSTSDIQQARLPLSRKYRDGGGDFLAQKTKVGLSEVTKPFLAQSFIQYLVVPDDITVHLEGAALIRAGGTDQVPIVLSCTQILSACRTLFCD